MTVRSLTSLAAIALCLAATGCGKGEKQAGKLDRELIGNAGDVDPALTGALEDQIMVDPALTQQSNATSATAARAPGQAPVPLTPPGPGPAMKGLLRAPAPAPAQAQGDVTLGELAQIQASASRNPKGCTREIDYGARYAARMPAAFPIYPEAQVAEAAGNELPGCRLRVVSFTSGAGLQQVLDYYYTQAVRGGFSAEHRAADGEHILAGARQSDDDAYYIFLRNARGGGTEVDLIATNGR